MKKLIASLCVTCLVAGAGCNSSPTGGRSGTTSSGLTGTHVSKKETFKLNGPSVTTKIEQGTSKTFKVSISRGSEFKDDVALKAESSDPKVHVTLDSNAFMGSEKKDVEATVKAADDAKLGESEITVTGSPQAGEPTTLAVKIDVTAKAKNK
jgi:uncharacterized membrane protein